MRANLEDVLARRIRHNSPSFNTVKFVVTGAFLIPNDGPTFYFLDPGASDRTVYLPALMEQGGQQYFIANTGANDLNVVDADGVAITTVGAGDTGIFISSMTTWRYIVQSAYGTALMSGLLAEPRIVTTSSFVVSSTEVGIAVNRAAPSATAGTLPAVATRNGLPISITDWSTSIVDHTITLTPNGAETIMRQATFPLYSNDSFRASVMLWPSVALSGWYMRP